MKPRDRNPRKPGPSRTAEGVAAIRAIESSLPEGERICYDPYAIRFVTPARLAGVATQIDQEFPGLRNKIVARVRYFDDTVREAAGNGFRQFVIMGAGYDTRAYRITELRSLRVFEVDEPDTQKSKVEKIREIFGALPAHVVYVPVDFESQDLGRRLRESGYSPAEKTLFVLEGVIMYLTPSAVDSTLSFIVHHSGTGSAVLFDCPVESGGDATSRLGVSRKFHDHVARGGEPIRFAIPGEGAESFLEKRGFSRVHQVTNDEIRQRYFQGTGEGRRFSRVSFVYAVTR
ncbi:MAG TPA: class I SAM-dependent methyltransferase [Methanomicrobiales archaeon]|nr:class I SAM-dependent methyltransferase [Methanomicrobiales archaeon]